MIMKFFFAFVLFVTVASVTSDKRSIKKFNNLKKGNSKLKTLAAIGEWYVDASYKLSQITKDPVKRGRFIQTSVEFLKKHDFDGLDMNWKYSAERDGDPKVDKTNFAIFIRELKEEFSKHNLLLTATVAAVEFHAEQSYDIPEISKHLDFINIEAYDFHGFWDKTIGMNAPLYESPVDVTPFQKQFNINASINYWISQGAPVHKINLGVPFYGRTFSLANVNQTKVGSPRTGPGKKGKYTNSPGMIGYNEIIEQFSESGVWTFAWDGAQEVPYVYRTAQWISYDDEKSTEYKVKYANDMNLGGIMVWSIETDDFRGIYGLKYPLLSKINTLFGRNIDGSEPEVPPTDPPTKPPTEPPTKPPITKPPVEGCKIDGYFPHPQDCSAFYVCFAGILYDFKCPANLVFNPELKVCDYPENVSC